jgi:hypothetical protein
VHAQRPLRALLFAILALVGVAGCAATQEAGAPFPSKARHELLLGRTTTRQAEKLLGRPLATTTVSTGRERWIYEHTRVSSSRAAPFGRRVTVRQTPYEQLVLTFQDGLLRECAYLVERYRTEGNLIVPAGLTREPCGLPGR